MTFNRIVGISWVLIYLRASHPVVLADVCDITSANPILDADIFVFLLQRHVSIMLRFLDPFELREVKHRGPGTHSGRGSTIEQATADFYPVQVLSR